uniref:Uncharacterized protein n=1 Tax=Magallana gigas TaxID=29159 RepID=K1RQQ1_MAGGI
MVERDLIELWQDRWWIGAREDTDNEVWVWDHSGDELVFTNWDTAGSQPNSVKLPASVFSMRGSRREGEGFQ